MRNMIFNLVSDYNNLEITEFQKNRRMFEFQGQNWLLLDHSSPFKKRESARNEQKSLCTVTIYQGVDFTSVLKSLLCIGNVYIVFYYFIRIMTQISEKCCKKTSRTLLILKITSSEYNVDILCVLWVTCLQYKDTSLA